MTLFRLRALSCIILQAILPLLGRVRVYTRRRAVRAALGYYAGLSSLPPAFPLLSFLLLSPVALIRFRLNSYRRMILAHMSGPRFVTRLALSLLLFPPFLLLLHPPACVRTRPFS